jgi:hypothetical protein
MPFIGYGNLEETLGTWDDGAVRETSESLEV